MTLFSLPPTVSRISMIIWFGAGEAKTIFLFEVRPDGSTQEKGITIGSPAFGAEPRPEQAIPVPASVEDHRTHSSFSPLAQ